MLNVLWSLLQLVLQEKPLKINNVLNELNQSSCSSYQINKTYYLYENLLYIQTGFLELINNMLTSGMVPALYSDEEKEQIIGQVGCCHF